MDALNKLLAIAALTMMILIGALFVVNLDSARLLGVHTARFVERSLDLAYYCMVGMMAFGALTGATWLGIWIAKRRNENMRQRDGSFPLQCVTVMGHKVYVDVNKTIAPALIVGRNGIQELFTAAPELHLQAALGRSKVSSMQAAFPGDHAIESKYGSQFRPGGMMNAASAKLMAGKYDPSVKMLPEPKPVEPDVIPATVRLLPVEEALMQNHRTQLVVGQTDAAEIVRWNMPETPHIRVHGSSQAAGKTNLIRCVATNALRVGHRVIVCDRRRFKDWSEFTNKAEFVDTKNPAEFAKVARRLQEIYQERDAELGRHGAPNIMRLAQPPQRIVVVVSEFGALCDQAKADGVLDEMLHPLSMVLREAGATGVHVVIEDQFVSEKWPKGISTNAEPVCGRLPQNYGAAGGYWRADKLPPYTFHYNGTIFRALDMRTVVPQAIATVRPSPPIIDAEYRVVRGDGGEGSTSGEQTTNTLHEGSANGATNTPTNKAGWYEWMLSDYFPTHPELLSTDAQGRGIGIMPMARAMALLARGDEGEAASYQGIASEIAQKLRNEFRVEGKK